MWDEGVEPGQSCRKWKDAIFFRVHLFVFELMLETQTTETSARRVCNPLQQHQQLWTILSRGPLQPWWGQGSDVKDQSSGRTSRLQVLFFYPKSRL